MYEECANEEMLADRVAKEAAEQWWEDRYLAVKKSEELLEATDEYRGVVVG